MKITERQKELAGWLKNFEVDDWKSKMLMNGVYSDSVRVDLPSPSEIRYIIGPWLDADWCFEFLKKISGIGIIDIGIQLNGIAMNLTDNNGKAVSYKTFFECSALEFLQEATRQAIIWLPEESRQVIKSMQ